MNNHFERNEYNTNDDGIHDTLSFITNNQPIVSSTRNNTVNSNNNNVMTDIPTSSYEMSDDLVQAIARNASRVRETLR